MLTRENILEAATRYDEDTYPADLYQDRLRVLRDANSISDELKNAISEIFHWKLGKITRVPTRTSFPLTYVNPEGRQYYGIKTTDTNKGAIEAATQDELVKEAIRFRDGDIPFEDFKESASRITKTSIVLPIFYLHIWKPSVNPIFDENVWKLYCREMAKVVKAGTKPGKWKHYEIYVVWFNQIVEQTGLDQFIADRGLWVLGGELKADVKLKKRKKEDITMVANRRNADHFRGCLVGGAVGDALGAPIEFLSLSQIRHKYGHDGIKDFDTAFGRIGAITDDTQMTLFTAEGFLRAECRYNHKGICDPISVIHGAYLRWLHTQGDPVSGMSTPNFNSDYLQKNLCDGWLIKQKELFSRRAPGNSCLSALRSNEMGTLEEPINDSKGCGGVMRVAPVGLAADKGLAFKMGCEVAAITHGHPTGYLAAGCLSAIINGVIEGQYLESAVDQGLSQLSTRNNHEECLLVMEKAIDLSKKTSPSADMIEKIGQGWVAEEALAISVYCALVHQDDFKAGVQLAVNHSGDSDSTGAITGNILGALLGESAIPSEWLQELELADVIRKLADDLVVGFEDSHEWWKKYPGW